MDQEKLLARSLLQPFGVFHHRGQPFLELRQRVARLHHVHIVEAVVGDRAFGHELESGVHLVFGAGNRVGGGVPWEGLCRTAELVLTSGAERVPVGHRELEVLLHGLAHHHAVLVVIMEGQRVLGLLAFEFDFPDSGEECGFALIVFHIGLRFKG